MSVLTIVAPFTQAVQKGLAALALAEAKVAEAVLTETQAIVALGATLLDAEAALLAADNDREATQKALQNLVGKAREWNTIRGWMRAASSAALLPEEVAKVYSAQALMELHGLREQKGTNGIVAVAKRQAKAGKVTVRPMREAVRTAKVKAGNGPTVKPTAKVAEALGRKWRDSAKAVNVEDPIALAFWGFTVGLAMRDTDQNREAGRKAIVDLFGPKAVDAKVAEALTASQAPKAPRKRRPKAAPKVTAEAATK